jgi:hypothetical protein
VQRAEEVVGPDEDGEQLELRVPRAAAEECRQARVKIDPKRLFVWPQKHSAREFICRILSYVDNWCFNGFGHGPKKWEDEIMKPIG